MSLIRRSLTLAVATSVALGGLSLGASAADSGKGRDVADSQKPKEKVVSRGLIIKTTTAKPSQAVLDAADTALDDKATVGEAATLTGKISTVDFSETVSEDVARDAAQELTKRADVEWAVPNSLRKHAANSPIPRNDPYFTQQRNVWSTLYSTPVGGYSIKAPYLWRSTYGDPDVTVAVVDTGITGHVDLDPGTIVPGYDMIGADQDENGVPQGTYETAGDGDGRDANPADPGDWATEDLCGYDENSSWHGTFIAGMIAAKSNNATSITGIAPGVKIQPVRVLGHCGGWDSDIVAGMTWASGGTVDSIPVNANKADVVNLSLNWTYDEVEDRDAACLLYSAAAAGGNARDSIFVAAAGNDAWDADLAVPSSCPGFVSVGATSMRGFSAFYSNGGPSVDLSAPGGDTTIEGSADQIRSLVNAGAHGPTGTGTTALAEGTSMSAAEVSAAAAMLYSLGMSTPAEVETALKESVSPFRNWDGRYGNYPINIDGDIYNFDLNCKYSTYCGTGILDFGKIQAPISGAKITGDAVVGETLTATPGSWNSNPTFTYTWLKGTTPVGSGTTYLVQPGDVGSALTVVVAPANPTYAKLDSRATTDVVPDGPDVTMTDPADTTFGQNGTTTVTLSNPAAEGPVEIRRGTTVLATGNAVAGSVELTIPGIKWVGGANVIRAAYLGDAGKAFSATQTVNVAKVTPSIPWYLPSSVKKGRTTQITVRVKPPVSTPVIPDSAATGTIKVYDGSKLILTFPIYGYHNGQRTWGLKFSSTGTHKIKVVYSGNDGLNGVTTAYKSIRVY